MIHKSIIKITLLLVFVCLFGAGLNAQELTHTITGAVTNEYGEPLAGVEVDSENKKNGTITNAQGEFTMGVDDGSQFLIFSYDNYQIQEIPINEEEELEEIQLQLQRDPLNQDEVVELGYTTQLRHEITGAVSTVSGEELARAPVANFAQTLPGRLSGLFTQETDSELSQSNTNMYIRGLAAARGGQPLVMIDGIMAAYLGSQTLDFLSAREIESVTVLKDASTQALYGIQGANGIIVITTKRGKKGGLQIDGRIDQSFQEATTVPTFYNSAKYAEMRNQAAVNDGLGQNYYFTDQQVENFRTGDNEQYPNNNWYNQFMRDFTTMERVGVNVTGGSDKVQFFSNLNFMHQGSPFITDQTEYEPNVNNTWVNYRTNVDMALNKYLTGFVRLSGNIRRNRFPGEANGNNEALYSSLFTMPPTTYGPLTPEVLDPDTGEVLEGGQVVTTERVGSPTYGMLNRSGYRRSTITNTISQFGLDLDLGFLTKGLDMSGVLAYQTNSGGHLYTTQNYERWQRTNDLDTLAFTRKGSQQNTPLAYSKDSHYYYHLTYKTDINYNREFGKHRIGGMAYAFYQNLTQADTGSPELLPYNRLSTGFQASYGYDDRYLAKFDVGYSGSEQYARGSRFIATPAISAAWIISNEAFLEDNNFLSLLKLRASYGQTANDASGNPRFAYRDDVRVSGGGPIPYFQYIITENQAGNPNIQAEISTKQNYGIDLGIFNSLSISLDVFKEYMDNMTVSPIGVIPLYRGIPTGNYPRTNTGIFENKGYEVSMNFNKSINRNFNIFASGMFSYAKNTVIDANQPLLPDDHAYPARQDGFSYGQQFGYLVDYDNGNGFFNSQTELEDSGLTYEFGEPRVGDLRFQDLNEDGIIDRRDQAPIGSGAIPRMIYAFSGGFETNAFDFSFLFQGIGDYSSVYGGLGIRETDFDGVFGALHENAWTPERYESGEPITAPALSTSTTVNEQTNDFYLYDRSYLRLKNLEIGFTLPEPATKALQLEKLRFLLSGQNLITWDNMKSDDFGPEGGGYSSFPVYRVYNLGLNIVF